MKAGYVYFLVLSVSWAGFCLAEFQVNTHTTNDQKNANIAMAPGGNFVVVWSSYGQDGSSNGVFGRRFDLNGGPLGEEFQINTTSSGNQTEPAVAMDATAGFVVAWHGPGFNDDDEEDIFVQCFDPNGVPFGDEILVNHVTSGKQRYPDVAMGGNGTFVVVWESENMPEAGKKAICGRIFESNGVQLEEVFMVNEEPAVCRYPVVSADANDRFAVAWLDDRSHNTILARLFDADGLARSDTFEVSTIPVSSVTRPSIAMNAEGYFVVVWDGDPDLAGLDDIHARLFDPNGEPFSEQFLVNTNIDGPQCYPQVAMNNLYDFMIVWESPIDPNVNERDIFGQCFNSLCESVGEEFLINSFIEGDHRYPSVAISEIGTFVTVWQSDDQDASRYGIFAEIGQIGDIPVMNDKY
ncbi:MAG: hypothetical protein JXM79_09850 [Sedimentisphaerales bacterium]|nr:hypothetical protein [Sedimentisphaerales bacterium]